jgi:hypothetical protein
MNPRPSFLILRHTGLRLVLLLFAQLAQSQEISTVGEIFDFDVGDEFHYTTMVEIPGGFGEEGIFNLRILDKYYSQPDYVVYIREYSALISYNGGPYQYFSHIDTTTRGPLDSLIYNGNIDTVYSSPELYNGRKINKYATFEGPYFFNELHFVDGCGQTYYYHNEEMELLFEDNMVYYKKGDEEWGTPQLVGIQSSRNETSKFKCYPNPFTNEIYFDFFLQEPSVVTILITDIWGQEIYRESKKQSSGLNKILWSSEHLSPGIYFYRISSQNKTQSGILVKEGI